MTTPDPTSEKPRAVSFILEHALGLFILLILTTTIIFGATQLLDQNEDVVIEQETDRLANEIAHKMISTQTTAERDTDPTIQSTTSGSYTIESNRIGNLDVNIVIREDGENITITTIARNVESTTTIDIDADLEQPEGTTLQTGEIYIRSDGDEITITDTETRST